MALKRSLAWMAFAQGAAFILQFAGSVVLARCLTVHDMGVYGVAAATVGVLYVIQAFGLQSLIVREEVLSPAITSTAFTVNALIALFLSACVLMLSSAGSVLLHDSGVRRVLLILSISPLFSIFDLLPSANLERNGDFRTMSIISMLAGIVNALVTVGLAFRGFSYMSIAYAGLFSGLTNSATLNFVARRHVSFQVGLTSWRRVASFGLQMMTISGVQTAASRLSDIILARLLGLSALGLYNRAGSLNNLLWNNIHLVIGRVVFVDFAELNRRGISLRQRYIRTVEVLTAILWPAFSGFALLSGPFVASVYGTRWLPATAPFALLAVGSIINVSITMTWELFAATGQLKAQTRIECLRAASSLAVFTLGCMFSLNAAAATRVLDSTVAFIVYRRHLNRMTQTTLTDFLPVYLRSAALTFLAVAPAALLMISFHMSSRVPLLFAIVSVVFGLVLWGFGLLVLRHPLAEEARVLFSRLRHSFHQFRPVR